MSTLAFITDVLAQLVLLVIFTSFLGIIGCIIIFLGIEFFSRLARNKP